jgi:hypothetical protein
MDDVEVNDYEHTISLFELINLIVDELISRPKKIKEHYDKLPQRQKDQINKRDTKPTESKHMTKNQTKFSKT